MCPLTMPLRLPTLCSSLRVADTFTSQPAPFATDVAIQTQRLTLDCVGLTAFSHDFGEVDAIAR